MGERRESGPARRVINVRVIWPSRPTNRDAGGLAGALRRVVAERGLTTREIVRRVGRKRSVTVYRVLAGKSPDLQVSTLVALCMALDLDPDRLLAVSGPAEPLDPELREALAQTRQLSAEDRRLLLTVLQAIMRR